MRSRTVQSRAVQSRTVQSRTVQSRTAQAGRGSGEAGRATAAAATAGPTDERRRLERELVRLREDVVRSVARRCRDEHEVEDVVQESLYRALRYGHTLAVGAPVLPWIKRIARNVLVDRAREAAAQHRPPDGRALAATDADGGGVPFAREPEPPELLEPEIDVWIEGRSVGFATARAAVAAACARLSPLERELLCEFHERGTPCREAARRHGLTADQVKVRLFRARTRVRARVERELRRGPHPAGLEGRREVVA